MQPTHKPDSKRGGSRRWLITVAVVAALLVGGAAAYGIGYLGTKGSNDAMQNAVEDVADPVTGSAYGGTSVHQRREDLPINSASPEEFYDDSLFSDVDRVAWANRQLQSSSADPTYPDVTVQEAAYERLQDQLAVEGRPALGPLVSPSIQNTANEANILRTVAIAAAYYEEDPYKGEKLLAAGIDNQHERSTEMRADLHKRHLLPAADRLGTPFEVTFTPNDAERLRASGHSVEMASPYSKNGSIGNIVPVDGLPTRVVYLRDSQDSGQETEEIQVYVGGRWTAHRRILPAEIALWIPPSLIAGILPK